MSKRQRPREVYISDSLWRKAKVQAAQEDMTASALVRRAIQQYLADVATSASAQATG